MTKKHFIQLADVIRKAQELPHGFLHNYAEVEAGKRVLGALAEDLADYCQSINPRFDRARWLGYIAGQNGPNGGAVKSKCRTVFAAQDRIDARMGKAAPRHVAGRNCKGDSK